jgi:hypothetical protein
LAKTLYIVLGVVIAIIVILAGAYFYVTGSSTRTAFLNIDSGQVQVDTGSGWQAATDGMDLGVNDKVKTLNGEATIVLHESVIITVEPNSEVAISDLSKDSLQIEQTEGSTWNKFTGLTGVNELSVKTPTTVATVRGTEFGVEMRGVLVGEGVVEVTGDGETFLIKAGKKIVMRDGKLVEEDLTPEEKARILSKMQNTLEKMKRLRMQEIEKKQFIYEKMKAKYDITDEEVKEYLNRADNGEFDLDEVEKKSPVNVAGLKKVKELTQKIIDQKKAMAEIERQTASGTNR